MAQKRQVKGAVGVGRLQDIKEMRSLVRIKQQSSHEVRDL